MPRLRIYNLFISHAWTYNADYYRLIDFLESASYFEYKNFSVPSHDPLIDPNTAIGDITLRGMLDNQIRPASCVLIISGMYAAYRRWIQEEIDIAQSYSKPIVGVRPWGSQRTPTVVTKAAHEMVGWNTSTIVRAIRNNSL